MNKLDKKESIRQVIHLVLGVVLVALIYFEFVNDVILGVFTVILFFLCYFSKNRKLPIVYWFLEKFEREEDMKKFPGRGPLFFVIGAFLVTALFDKDIASAAIVILAIGDSVPYFVGGSIRKIKHPLSDKKFLEGTIAGFVLAFLAASIFVSFFEAFLAALGAMIAEGIEIKLKKEKIDDNILIPVVSGAVIWFIRYFKSLL